MVLVTAKTTFLIIESVWNWGRNQMLHDMGLQDSSMDNSDMVEDKIQQVDHQFDLVLIAER